MVVAALVVLLGGTACAGTGASAGDCWAVTSREIDVLKDVVGPVLRDSRLGKVRLYEMDGCDSADGGAWLEAEVEDVVSEEEISAVFESHGWSTNPYDVPECRPGRCGVDLARQDASHLVGIRFLHREGMWRLEIVSL
ncbi:hypothetical protein SAMN05421874_12326 [Nonomuraea maritima]|uniref:Lipoprotein n=1 Tax=Nonomuraea maritima TaxID=683260 RepID=A0A1G9KQT4_9ACTN|nr:hypothetical protein SAMN05421874_12326 [Nonomuraea maritima]